MSKLYTMNISLVKDEDVESISKERKEKALRYFFERDRKLSIAASLLIDQGLREYGLREKNVIYSYGEYGKPYFRDYPSIHFSLAHSGNMAAVAFSDALIGCDIEHIRPYDEDIASMCFMQGEKNLILSSDDTSFAFTRLWCIKESFLKAIGLGLQGGMKSFEVKTDGDKVHFIENFDRKRWKITTDVVDNHFIAVCEENLEHEN